MTTSVKYFHGGMGGAPQLDNVWGCMIAMLDAVLVNGFNLKAVTQITRSANQATLTVGSGHGFEVDQVVVVAGADQPEYNGQFRITDLTSSTIGFQVSGLPVSPATGSSITVKAAPLGFSKPYSEGATKAAYRSTDPQSTGTILRVFDYAPAGYTSNAKAAMVEMVSALTDINTPAVGAFQVPFTAADPNRNWTANPTANAWGWMKWYYSIHGAHTNVVTAGSRNWFIIGDERAFYLFNRVTQSTSYYGRTGYFFGDILNYRSNEAGHCLLSAADSYNLTSLNWPDTRNEFVYMNSYTTASRGTYMMRPASVVGQYPEVVLIAATAKNGSLYSSGWNGGAPWPNPTNYGIVSAKVSVQEIASLAVRGSMPGMYSVLNSSCTLADLERVNNIPELPNQKLIYARLCSSISGGGAVGNVTYPEGLAGFLFDLNVPWR